MKINVLLAACAVTAIGSIAQAGLIGDPITITASDESGRFASWTLSAASATWINDVWTCEITEPIEFVAADGTMLGRINNLSVEYIADPVVSLGFTAQAGLATTHFTVTSALLTFPVINAEARASAAITLTDTDGDGASILGLAAGGRTFAAHYNGFIPGGTQFATLAPSITVGPFASQITSEQSPAGPGFVPIGNTVDMSTRFDFELSANDLASGTGVFVTRVIPAPGALALAGVGLLAAARRRR